MYNDKDISEKTIVVTGATAGIGLATALGLVRRGAFVIGVGRSPKKCKEAEEAIKISCPEARIVFHVADLSSLKQVKELAEGIKQRIVLEGKGCIDALINNAGTVSSWYVSTAEGFELQFAVNYLAPFLLTGELLPLLKAAPSGRVITVSSGSHYRTKINWNDILMRKRYNCLSAYKQCKLANVMFTYELNRRLGSGSTVRAYAVDPGLVNTDIGLKGTAGIVRWVWLKRSKNGVTPQTGAATSIYLAAEPSIPDTGDYYWKDCRPQQPSRYSLREDTARRLWELSERMCGVAPAAGGIGNKKDSVPAVPDRIMHQELKPNMQTN